MSLFASTSCTLRETLKDSRYLRGGDLQMISVCEMTLASASMPPKLQLVGILGSKLEPLIVTIVPPSSFRRSGLTLDIRRYCVTSSLKLPLESMPFVVIPRFQTPGTKEDGTSQMQTDDEMIIARSYNEPPNWQPKESVSMKFLPVTVTVLKLPSAKIDGYTDVRPIGGWNLNCKPDSMVSLLD